MTSRDEVAAVHVICTAGHVDHGKSTLVRALTGMEPDRLAEEHRRSLTIDIGFAWFDLTVGGEPRTVAFVDLPGHHRFIGNMLAGASSVTVALVVVSADDGPMQQTIEHLQILDLLGVEHAVVALTKTDTVDSSTVGIAIELTRDALAPTSLAQAPIIPVSAVTGDNLDLLCVTVAEMLATLPPEPDLGRPRLWVDRSFSIRGAGTVVTGTLRHGSLAVDDEVVVLPGQRAVRIRGLESLGRGLARAEPGGRVAVNLVGLGRDDLRRGDAIGRSGQWLDARALEGYIKTLPSGVVSRRGDWHLHCGSGEWRVELTTIDGADIPAGGEGYVRLELPSGIPVAPGDRFVLRESGRQATVGGGVILDCAPGRAVRGRAGRAERVARLEARAGSLHSDDPIALLVDHARAHGLVARGEALAIAGLEPSALAGPLDARLVQVGPAYVAAAEAALWRSAAVAFVGKEHESNPLARAVPRDLVTRTVTAAGCPPELAAHLLNDAVERGDLARESGGWRLPSHRVILDAAQASAADRLISLLDEAGFAPPDLDWATREAGAAAVVRELEASQRLVRITPDIAMSADMLDRAHRLLWHAYLKEGPLTASQARDALQTTRKYVLPLLAVLDQRGMSHRQGDLRVVHEVAEEVRS